MRINNLSKLLLLFGVMAVVAALLIPRQQEPVETFYHLTYIGTQGDKSAQYSTVLSVTSSELTPKVLSEMVRTVGALNKLERVVITDIVRFDTGDGLTDPLVRAR